MSLNPLTEASLSIFVSGGIHPCGESISCSLQGQLGPVPLQFTSESKSYCLSNMYHLYSSLFSQIKAIWKMSKFNNFKFFNRNYFMIAAM